MRINKSSFTYMSLLLLVGCGGGNNTDIPPKNPSSPSIPDVSSPLDSANMSVVSGWGSSSMEMLANPMREKLKTRFSVNYYDGGHSGEYSSHIAARLGAIPLQVTIKDITQQDNGLLTLNSLNVLRPELFKKFNGTLQEKQGDLSISKGQLVFQAQDQAPSLFVDVPATFIPNTLMYKNSPLVVWSGKNDVINKISSDVIVNNTQAICDWSSVKKYCLVIGLFSNSSWTKDRTEMKELNRINQQYQSLFGANYLDVQAYLMSPQIWLDTGISPTSQDLIQQQNGVKPDSLSTDDYHLNQKTMIAIAIKITNKMVELGWYVDK